MAMAEQSKRIRELSRSLQMEKQINRRLRRKNAALRRRLSASEKHRYSDIFKPFHNGGDESSESIHTNQTSNIHFVRQTSVYPSICFLLRDSYVYRFILRIWSVFRKMLLLNTVISVVSVLLASTVFLTFFLTALPFAVATVSLSVMLTVLFARRKNRTVLNRIKEKQVHKFCPSRCDSDTARPFGYQWAIALARDASVTVLVVTPNRFLSHGIPFENPFLTIRKTADGFYTIRPIYYLSLKKRVLNYRQDGVSIIYL